MSEPRASRILVVDDEENITFLLDTTLRHFGFEAPSFAPLRLAAARAVFVRSEIRRASSSATAARMWIVSRVAWGLSQATNSTPDS